MKRIIMLFVGIILIVVAMIVFFVPMGTVTINDQIASPETGNIVKYAVAGFLGLLGLIFLVVGIIMAARGSKQKKVNQQIMQYGIAAEGTVTFVDKNWTLLVNNNPIYSIIEYTYTTSNGAQHTRRITNASSEMVIRMGIQVGSKLPIKYSPQNPGESVIVISG